MDVFRKVASVRSGGVTETLNWDGRDGFILEGSFPAIGHRVEVEKMPDEARRDLIAWGDLAKGGRCEVLLADEGALTRIMRGLEWHPLAATKLFAKLLARCPARCSGS
jgi:hypothetical protein